MPKWAREGMKGIYERSRKYSIAGRVTKPAPIPQATTCLRKEYTLNGLVAGLQRSRSTPESPQGRDEGGGTMMSDRARVIGAALRGELMAVYQKAFMTSSSVQPFTRTDILRLLVARWTASTPPYHQCAVGPTTVSST